MSSGRLARVRIWCYDRDREGKPPLPVTVLFLKRKGKMQASSIEVRSSLISGRGVYALAKIRKGEVVQKWNPQVAHDIYSLSPDQLHYTARMSEGCYQIMGEPERFVNHSCNPNTIVSGLADVALRDIEAGEEITSSYSDEKRLSGFQCKCGAENCRHWIGPKNR